MKKILVFLTFFVLTNLALAQRSVLVLIDTGSGHHMRVMSSALSADTTIKLPLSFAGGISTVYGLAPVQIHGGDTVGVNLAAGAGIAIAAGATFDTIKSTITQGVTSIIGGTGIAVVTNGTIDTIKYTGIDTAHQAGTGITINYGVVRDTINLSTPVTTANGGTGTGTAGTQFGVLYYTTTTQMASTGAGTTGQFLGANTAGAPTWQTPAGGSDTAITGISPMKITHSATTDTVSIPLISVAGTHNLNEGYGANGNRSTGSFNISLGDSVNWKNAIGSYDIGIGYQALYNEKSTGAFADTNIAIGYQALFNNALSGLTSQGAGKCIGIGFQSLFSDTSGAYNVALGNYAGHSFLTRDDVVVIGDHAAYNADKMNVVAIGYYSLFTMTGVGVTDPDVVAVGYRSLYNATGTDNTAVGWNSAEAESGGNDNTAIGSSALYKAGNTYSASDGTAVGADALAGVTTGGENTGIGFGAGAGITTGSNNTSLGSTAGQNNNTTGSNNTCVGYNANTHFSTSNPQDRTAIGANADVTADSTVQLGDSHLLMVNTSGGITEGGKLLLQSVNKSANYTFDASGTDYCVIESGNGTTVTLPATATLGRHCEVVFANTTATNTMTVSGNGHNISGNASITLNAAVASFTAQNSVLLVGDGTNWWIVGSN